MMKFTCPNCAQKTISVRQKLMTTKVSSTECTNCGARLNTTYVAQLLVISPFLAFIALDLALNSSLAPAKYLSMVGAVVIATLLINLFVVRIVATPKQNGASAK
jgi:hypothetical protein